MPHDLLSVNAASVRPIRACVQCCSCVETDSVFDLRVLGHLGNTLMRDRCFIAVADTSASIDSDRHFNTNNCAVKLSVLVIKQLVA